MQKKKFLLRNVATIFACLAATTVFSGCDPGNDPDDPNNPPVVGELTELKSPITQNTTLKDLGLPIDYVYKGTSLLEVKNNATLTIEPGVTIQFTNKGGGIEIKDGATIKALGTADKRIQFVGGATKGSWDRVNVKTTADNQFAYVDFINGGSRTDLQNFIAVLTIENGQCSITHCKISGSLNRGFSILDDCRISAFNNNVIENCDDVPVRMRGQLKMMEKFDMTSDFTNNTKQYIEMLCAQFHSEDATLQQTTVPYFFNSDIGYFDSRLTISEGVTIYMGDGKYIAGTGAVAEGVLNINGTVEKPVLFTRLPGTTYYWQDIGFRGLTGSVIKNCVFEYGGKSNNSGILKITTEADLTLENVVIRNSYNYGVTIDEWGGTYRLTHSNVTFADNYKGNVLMYRAGTVRTDLP